MTELTIYDYPRLLKFSLADRVMLELRWRDIEELLNRSLEQHDGKYLPEDIHDWILEGKMQCWCAMDMKDDKLMGISITEIQVFRTQKRLYVPFASALAIKDVVCFFEVIVAWARIQNCKSVDITGSRAWLKILKPYGFVEQSIYASLNLEGNTNGHGCTASG